MSISSVLSVIFISVTIISWKALADLYTFYCRQYLRHFGSPSDLDVAARNQEQSIIYIPTILSVVITHFPYQFFSYIPFTFYRSIIALQFLIPMHLAFLPLLSPPFPFHYRPSPRITVSFISCFAF